jgi:hypothetical protein
MKLLIKSDKRMATYREKGYDIAIIVLWDPESKPQKQKTKSKITVDGEECESGYCDTQLSECASALANGESCDFDSDCESGYCDWDIDMCAADSNTGDDEVCAMPEEEEADSGE